RPLTFQRIYHLGCGSVREFADSISREPIIKEVRHCDQALCGEKDLGRISPGRDQLIEGVDGHELDAGDGVDLFLRNLAKDFLHDTAGATVAIMVGVLEEFSPLSKQRVIHTPGVYADSR